MSSLTSKDSITTPKRTSLKYQPKRPRNSSIEQVVSSDSRTQDLDETSLACGAPFAQSSIANEESKTQSKQRLEEIVLFTYLFICLFIYFLEFAAFEIDRAAIRLRDGQRIPVGQSLVRFVEFFWYWLQCTSFELQVLLSAHVPSLILTKYATKRVQARRRKTVPSVSSDAASVSTSGCDSERPGESACVLCSEGEGGNAIGDDINQPTSEGAVVLQNKPGGVQLHDEAAEGGSGLREVLVGFRASDQLEANKEVLEDGEIPTGKRQRFEPDEQLHTVVLKNPPKNEKILAIIQQKQEAHMMLKEIKKKDTQLKKKAVKAEVNKD